MTSDQASRLMLSCGVASFDLLLRGALCEACHMGWRLPIELCTRRDDHDLLQGCLVLGASLNIAVESGLRLEALRQVGFVPVAPHLPSFDREAWSALQTMLVEERRLMEFLVGPRTDRAGKHIQPDDICIVCFALNTSDIWRLPQPVESVFRARSTRINKRIAHFAWVLTTDDPRTTDGTWQTGYLRQVAVQLSSFCEWLADRRPLIAAALQGAMTQGLDRSVLLPAPSAPWP